MEQEDYEAAAQHIHKFLTLDSAVFQMGDQVDAKGFLKHIFFFNFFINDF